MKVRSFQTTSIVFCQLNGYCEGGVESRDLLVEARSRDGCYLPVDGREVVSAPVPVEVGVQPRDVDSLGDASVEPSRFLMYYGHLFRIEAVVIIDHMMTHWG